MKCACFSERDYKRCCGQYHGGMLCPNALTLMRSRYAAYALRRVNYIIETTHPACIAYCADLPRWTAELQKFCRDTQFTGLTILRHETRGAAATVHFVARLSRLGRDASFSEVSDFIAVEGRWLYRAGRVQP